ncbi:MmgE/PrpD family protein [Caballeronia sp. GAWG2-1]|uniref:MmgE/PrpD family protein n=1 Tax=Caballeronia sp. GAWG2-1 TaxID=2921744 RepID=UPI0020298A75|nr:MmgE/PrpD family protein [Caballeronia sp. GAWG2-1]
MKDQDNRTSELCKFLMGLKFDDIPESTLERTKDLLLDHLGVALLSSQLPWTRIVREQMRLSSGRAESTVYGCNQKMDRRAAALINGTAAHGIELDDTHNASFSHPGAVVIATAMSVAEAEGRSGRELLASIVAGYEAQGRAGAAASGALGRGFHPTAAAGVFGATAACAHLGAMESSSLESAFGLAASAASGVMQFAEDPEGNMIKRLHGGLPAMNGILMAELAKAGFKGPRAALDGRFGFVSVFGGGGDCMRITRDLGRVWEIDQISVKLYACCRHFHSAIDALRACLREAQVSSDDIEWIDVFLTPIALDGRLQYRPKSVMAAQYSLPYAMAATVLLDPQNPSSFSEEAVARPALVGLMDRVRGHADQLLEKYLPEQFPANVCVSLRDGRKFSRMLPDSIGTPGFPLDRDGVVSKFDSLVGKSADHDWGTQLKEEVLSIDRAPDLSRLTKILRRASFADV